jgi:DNA repair exonuclease SbcCD ATPase subunit
MKKLFAVTILISFAMICSCQKQAQRKAEPEASEKASDEREKELEALAEREKALAEREKALAERMKPTATIPPNLQSRGQVTDPAQLKALPGQVTDPAQMKAQREKNLQQLPPEVHALIPDPATVKAQRDATMQKQRARAQRMLEEFQRKRSEAEKKDPMRHADQSAAARKSAMRAMTAAPAVVFPGSEATSPPSLEAPPPPAYTAAPAAVYPGAEATSPPSLEASPATETASPTPSPTPQ